MTPGVTQKMLQTPADYVRNVGKKRAMRGAKEIVCACCGKNGGTVVLGRANQRRNTGGRGDPTGGGGSESLSQRWGTMGGVPPPAACKRGDCQSPTGSTYGEQKKSQDGKLHIRSSQSRKGTAKKSYLEKLKETFGCLTQKKIGGVLVGKPVRTKKGRMISKRFRSKQFSGWGV